MQIRNEVMLFLLPGILLLVSACVQATEVLLSGELAQGGLVYGMTATDAAVFLDGYRLSQARDGSFVFGFGRDAPAMAVLRISKGADTVHRILTVRERLYKTQRIDGLPQQLVSPPPIMLKRIRKEAQLISHARSRYSLPGNIPRQFIWPLHGQITGVYGSRRILNGMPRQPHFGIDIACPSGTLVRAPAAAVVTLAHPDMYFTGMTMILDHGYGISSTLLHLSEMLAAEGDAVIQGEVIAKVGSTGRSTGPHLDWRVNWLKARLDPALLAGTMPQDRLCMQFSPAAR